MLVRKECDVRSARSFGAMLLERLRGKEDEQMEEDEIARNETDEIEKVETEKKKTMEEIYEKCNVRRAMSNVLRQQDQV